MKDCADKIPLESLLSDLDDVFINANERAVYRIVVAAVERPLIEKVLEKTFGNQVKAAKILGIHRNTLKTKISKLGIHPEKWKI